MSSPKQSFYLAADLFSSRALFGNAALAEAIQHASRDGVGPELEAVLPQLCEPRDASAKAIRNFDLRSVVTADALVLLFEGMELDSGMVVEFMLAKFCDIPTVIVRTDFRSCGEHPECPWNLMLGSFPRCETVRLNAMEQYRKLFEAMKTSASCKGEVDSAQQSIAAMQEALNSIAQGVVQKLREVMTMPSIMPEVLRGSVYEWVRHFPGGGFESELSPEELTEILKRRFVKG